VQRSTLQQQCTTLVRPRVKLQVELHLLLGLLIGQLSIIQPQRIQHILTPVNRLAIRPVIRQQQHLRPVTLQPRLGPLISTQVRQQVEVLVTQLQPLGPPIGILVVRQLRLIQLHGPRHMLQRILIGETRQQHTRPVMEPVMELVA
jgi:hypothetical protein